MPAVVKDEVRKFAATTSVRGIPRALQAKDPVIRTIWSVAVLLCLSILLWQLTFVVMRYFKYESTTLFKEGSDTPVKYAPIIEYFGLLDGATERYVFCPLYAFFCGWMRSRILPWPSVRLRLSVCNDRL